MKPSNAYVINRLPAFWLSLAFGAIGIGGVYLLFINVLYDGYADMDMVLFIMASVPAAVLGNLLARLVATNKVEVSELDEQIIIKWLPSILIRNRPDTIFHKADIKDYVCTFSGTQYKSIEFDPHYGWNLKLRRSVFLLPSVQYFDSLVTGIINVLRPTGPLAETEFFKSLAADISIEETVGVDTSIITCHAKKIYWGPSKALAAVWLIWLGIISALITFQTAKYPNPEDIIFGLALCTIFLLPISLIILKILCTVQLNLVIYTDKVVVQQMKNMFFKDIENRYHYSDINELLIENVEAKDTRIIINTAGRQYKFQEMRGRRSRHGVAEYYVADYLAGVYQIYLNAHKESGIVKLSNTQQSQGHIKVKQTGVDWYSFEIFGELVALIIECL